MISTCSSFSSSVPLLHQNGIANSYSYSKLNSIRLRPSTISASCASTVERPSCHITSTSSLYDVLGIRMGATCQEIKSAYRRLARVVHPDVVSNGQRSQTSGDEFIRIHEAYSTLSDPVKRADYDRQFYVRRRPVSSSFSTTSFGSGFSSRNWETDQCW